LENSSVANEAEFDALAVEAYFSSPGPRGKWYRSLVDRFRPAKSPGRHRLTEYYTDVSYRCTPSDSPSPFSPLFTPMHTNLRSQLTLPALDTTLPAGWIDDGGNETPATT